MCHRLDVMMSQFGNKHTKFLSLGIVRTYVVTQTYWLSVIRNLMAYIVDLLGLPCLQQCLLYTQRQKFGNTLCFINFYEISETWQNFDITMFVLYLLVLKCDRYFLIWFNRFCCRCINISQCLSQQIHCFIHVSWSDRKWFSYLSIL